MLAIYTAVVVHIFQPVRLPHCFVFCIPLTTDGPQRARLPIRPTATLPYCLWSLRIFPSLPVSRLTNLYRDSSALLQLINQWLNFTYSRSHAFRCGTNNTNSDFHKNQTILRLPFIKDLFARNSVGRARTRLPPRHRPWR